MPTTRIQTIDGDTIDDVVRVIKENRSDEPDIDIIRQAYAFTKSAHGKQLRKSGEPYIVHPLAVAMTLADLGMDEATVAAGLLHDVPEDTDTTLNDIHDLFGEEIAFLVEGITKLGQIKYRGVDRYVENLRRMFVATAQDTRVILIKFADRMNNLRTLDALPPAKRRRIALESLEIFAPIANRLGMGQIKGDLEDLSFPYVYPEEYRWITEKVVPQFADKQQFMYRFHDYMEREFITRNIDFVSMHSRTKHLYSLYQKLLKNNRDLQHIYDVVALRIIVPNIAKCYETLGNIHQICKPLKGRIKDYIAQPKPNGYQSLHTTVFSPAALNQCDIHDKDCDIHGEIIEIQIRTPEMHAEAEYGIAAHWRYKESNEQYQEKLDRTQTWMRQMVELETEAVDEEGWLESMKLDFFQNRIFVFTPRGDVIELPEDATPVDFAYRIHTNVGNTCVGAKINDTITSLSTRLNNGDVVEILTDSHRQGPSGDWMAFVKTNTAQHHIRAYLNKTNKQFGLY